MLHMGDIHAGSWPVGRNEAPAALQVGFAKLSSTASGSCRHGLVGSTVMHAKDPLSASRRTAASCGILGVGNRG